MNFMAGNKKYNYLVETALLGHGLKSVNDSLITSIWPEDVKLAWIENGEIIIGDIQKFISVRRQSESWERIDGAQVLKNDYKGKNAFLTASGTMSVAKEINCPVVVTAGIGGIGDIVDEEICYDLPALSSMGITLIATSPKDMLDIEGTINWLHKNQVNIYGFNTDVCTGYICILDPIKLYKEISDIDIKNLPSGCNLILNPIPHEKRLKDIRLLEGAILAGKNAEKNGKYYHPAVNAYFDKETKGVSSIMQLDSLISNIKLAKKIKIV